MKKLLALVLALVLVLSLAGCGGKNDLIGEWYCYSGSYQPFIWTFNPDGTHVTHWGAQLQLTIDNGSYRVEGENLYIGNERYVYSLEGDKLTARSMSNPLTYVFRREK